MRMVGILLPVFMVSALGGWFGARHAVKEARISAPVEAMSQELADLRSRVDALRPLPEGGGGGTLQDQGAIDRSEFDPEGRPAEEAESRNEDSRPPVESAKVDVDSPTSEQHAARADRETIVLTDLEGRSVEVELVEVSSETIRIIRRQDRREFNLPVHRLIPADREFVDYLVGTGRFTPNSATNPDEIDWDAIFGN